MWCETAFRLLAWPCLHLTHAAVVLHRTARHHRCCPLGSPLVAASSKLPQAHSHHSGALSQSPLTLLSSSCARGLYLHAPPPLTTPAAATSAHHTLTCLYLVTMIFCLVISVWVVICLCAEDPSSSTAVLTRSRIDLVVLYYIYCYNN
jgi:hypothetical protein